MHDRASSYSPYASSQNGSIETAGFCMSHPRGEGGGGEREREHQLVL